jgi:arylsulfatase A-like enzyme
MVAGPGIPENAKVDADVYLQDIMATSLELAGIPKPEHVFFNSFLGLAQGDQQDSHYPAVYGAYVDFQRMIRKDGFKLLVYPKIEKVLLFDLEQDPNETNDLAEDPEYRERIKSMFGELLALQEEMQDPLDLQPLAAGLMME